MEILAALFVEQFDLRQVAGGSARLDLTGVYFSVPASDGYPVRLEPHLVVLVRCRPDHAGVAALEVVFRRDGEQVARNVQPLQVEPGKFNYRLVRSELEWTESGTVEAHCRVDDGPVVVVPLAVVDV